MSQKITYAKIENFKGIKSLEMTNLSRFVGIFGANGAGKSSCIEAIQNAIKLQHNGNAKVRYGEDNGLIEVHFGDEFKIRRVVGSNGKLEVEVDGEKIVRPQARLDEIFQGAIGDPHRFIDMHKAEKVRYILSVYGKQEEYDKLESDRSLIFDERTEKGRLARAKEQEVEEIDTDIFEAISESVDISSLESELEDANTHNRTYYDLKNRKETGQTYLENAKKEEVTAAKAVEDAAYQIAELEEKLHKLKQTKKSKEEAHAAAITNVGKAEDRLEEIDGQIEAFDKIDTAPIKDALAEARTANEHIIELKTKKTIYDKNVQKSVELRAKRKELDDSIKEIEEAQNSLLGELDITYKVKVEDGQMLVFIDEQRIPIDELNTATQIDLALDVMLAGPNKIKIITIENANSLDPSMMEKVKAKIEKAKGQCFLETVYKTGYETITIENGEEIK